MCKTKRKNCYNCKFSTDGFKVGDLTHHHCLDPIQYPEDKIEAGEISPWDTLREWWDNCDNYQAKTRLQVKSTAIVAAVLLLTGCTQQFDCPPGRVKHISFTKNLAIGTDSTITIVNRETGVILTSIDR